MNLTSIGFIPDGNRRYANDSHISLAKSYEIGTQKALDTIEWIQNFREIKIGTFYTLSLENTKRSSHELSVLYHIFSKQLNKIRESEIFEKYGIKLNFIGKLNVLPKKIQNEINKAEKYTERFSNEKVINIAIAYNGQEEIVDAAKKIALTYKENNLDLNELNTDSFQKYLYEKFPNPDLIIRTSGTKRLSGFLTYQSSYSELKFIEKNWPAIEKTDIENAINEYHNRNRKFGL